jgi:hypothetical protein
MIQAVADWLFSDAWKQCAAKYQYAVDNLGVTHDRI